MIIFLNFIPFDFGGGAERWMLDVSSSISKFENAVLVDVDRSISNIYARVVLQRKLDNRLKINTTNSRGHISLTLSSFIPFSSQWILARSTFRKARLIYIRYELLETLTVLYFGGFSAFKKTIAGIHSPFIYTAPRGFFECLHNFVYTSKVSRWILSTVKKIHVLNPTDENFFAKKFHLSNVVRIPNYIDIKTKALKNHSAAKNQILNIAYVGELSMRKGTDILVETIKDSPDEYIFHIAGDGYMKEEVEKLKSSRKVKYYGYLSKEKLTKLYEECDVLFIPSRAESFSLVGLEAMSHGLPLISSAEISLNFTPYVQLVNIAGTPKGYVGLFKEIFKRKKDNKLNTQKIKVKDFAKKTFSRDVIMPILIKKVFEL